MPASGIQLSRGLCPLWPAFLGTTGQLTQAPRSSPVTHGATGHALGAPLCPMSLPDWLRGGWDGPSVGSANSQGRRQESTVAGSRAGQCLASESHWPGADTGPAIAKKLGHIIYLLPQDWSSITLTCPALGQLREPHPGLCQAWGSASLGSGLS